MDTKIQAFEYTLKCLLDWHQSTVHDVDSLQSFDKIKAFKLHFFVAAINATEKDKHLLTTFDNFYALPYGHVESSIYNKLSETNWYAITNNQIDLKGNRDLHYFDSLHNDIKEKIDSSIEALKSINPDIITYPSFKLVDISHKWQSWIAIFNLAKMFGKRSMEIPTDFIQKETKIFE